MTMITINLITEESTYPDLYARLHDAALKKTKSFFDPWLESLDGDSRDLAEYLRDSFFDLCRANSGSYLSHNPEETYCR